jgi:hypothetical protein
MWAMHRVADADRERASDSLRRHYERGRLTFDELSDRVEVAIRAETNGDLSAALRGLPAPWHPSEVAPRASAAGHAAARVFLFLVLAAVWSVVSFVLLIVFLVVLAADASATTELVIPAAWVFVTYLLVRAWRRPLRRARR